jgi:hypothetical protein
MNAQEQTIAYPPASAVKWDPGVAAQQPAPSAVVRDAALFPAAMLPIMG